MIDPYLAASTQPAVDGQPTIITLLWSQTTELTPLQLLRVAEHDPADDRYWQAGEPTVFRVDAALPDASTDYAYGAVLRITSLRAAELLRDTAQAAIDAFTASVYVPEPEVTDTELALRSVAGATTATAPQPDSTPAP